jgi:hypothetical protein
MLGLEIRPVWKRKNKKAKSEDTHIPTSVVDSVAIAEEAIERLAIKLVMGAVIVTGSTILLSTAGRIIETAFENHTKNES